MDIATFIQDVRDQDFTKSGATFNELMMAKVADALEQEKIKVAGTVFNGDEDEEQLDLPLDADEESGDEDENDDDDESEEDEESDEEVEITGDEEEVIEDEESDEDVSWIKGENV